MTSLEHRSLQSCKALLAWAYSAEDSGRVHGQSPGSEGPEDATHFIPSCNSCDSRLAGRLPHLHTY